MVIENVEDLELAFVHSNSAVARSLLGAARFPNVHRLKLECDSRGEDEYSDVQCQRIIEEVLPNSSAFPKVECLELDIHAEGAYDAQTHTFAPNKPITIPFSSIRDVRILGLTTWDTMLEPLKERTVFPKLRGLKLKNCRNLSLTWFLTIFEQVTLEDGLEQPFGLEIEGCPWGPAFYEAYSIHQGAANNDSEKGGGGRERSPSGSEGRGATENLPYT